MLDLGVREDIDRAADHDLALACDKARSLVAERPNDEEAALLLRGLVERLAQRGAGEPSPPNQETSPDVRKAAELLSVGSDEEAEILLRRHLANNRNDPTAMHLMAEIAARCGFFEDAERVARLARQADPGSADILLTLARILFHRVAVEDIDNGRSEEALELVDDALRIQPRNAEALRLKASFLNHLRRPEAAVQALQQAVEIDPTHAIAWVNHGMSLKTIGEVGKAVGAFRTALAIDPSNGQGWWELANLKTIKLSSSDAAALDGALSQGVDLDPSRRAELHFAAFKAYDDQGRLELAAEHLAAGNSLKRSLTPYDAAQVTADVERAIATFTPRFFVERATWGSDTDELIFVVGMQRSGSTLVEQILSSHSKIEGTEELFYILEMAGEIQAALPGQSVEGFLESATPAQVGGLSGKLLELSRRHKHSSRPYFIDKNPSNWRHLGLIHTLLPRAKIIDVRRNPLDCCFANYTQHYETGVAFSYDQEDLARYYSDYVRLMRHFGPVLGPNYHLVVYEDLVESPEVEMRRLIDFLGLEFEESCLRFFETERPIYTPSAQQVRRPINSSGIGRWKPYEAWLRPLREALGELPEAYRN